MDKKLKLEDIYSRNELAWGKEAQKLLFEKHVVVFGLGGVGSYAVDALARSGVGRFTLIDFDKVVESNINRQLIALLPDVGKSKTELMKNRIKMINPSIQVDTIDDFYTSKLNKLFDVLDVDFVIDAIDTLRYKIELIETCKHLEIPIISSMGAGNRLDPTQLYIADISEVKSGRCPFIKNVLNKLKLKGITEGVTVVTSRERPISGPKVELNERITTTDGEDIDLYKFVPASVPFVPPVAGYFMASYVVKTLLGLS